MTALPDDISYDEWVRHVFDHDDKGWHWDLDALDWDESKNERRAREYMTRLFKNMAPIMQRYTADQIGWGINYLVSNDCSNYVYSLVGDDADIGDRCAGIMAISDLFRDCFAKLCVKALGHLSEEGNSCNYICYMFWDTFALYGSSSQSHREEQEQMNRQPLHVAALKVMRYTLSLPHIACIESGLHGLGHWHHAYPNFVETEIYKRIRKGLPRKLETYAQNAARGYVE